MTNMTIKEKINTIKDFLDDINMAVVSGHFPENRYVAFLKSLKWHIPTNWAVSQKQGE